MIIGAGVVPVSLSVNDERGRVEGLICYVPKLRPTGHELRHARDVTYDGTIKCKCLELTRGSNTLN